MYLHTALWSLYFDLYSHVKEAYYVMINRYLLFMVPVGGTWHALLRCSESLVNITRMIIIMPIYLFK